jgi:hypothetical protein
MRASLAAVIIAAAIVAASLLASGLSVAQSRTNTYQRCVELAARQGLNTKSPSGRRFVNRCMQSDSYDHDTYGRGSYRPSRNCPDDSKARSAYPAWMCP